MKVFHSILFYRCLLDMRKINHEEDTIYVVICHYLTQTHSYTIYYTKKSFCVIVENLSIAKNLNLTIDKNCMSLEL